MKSNAIRLYKHACEMCINPLGADSLERANVKKQAEKSKEQMEQHFKTAPKYRNDPEIQALISPTKKEIKEEIKENVKPKRRNKSSRIHSN